MSARMMVIAHVKERMMTAFIKGDLIDAQNMNIFVASLEGMTDVEYAELAEDHSSSAIA